MDAQWMDVQTIADRTRIPVRKVRYVLDHRMLPGLRTKSDEERVGHPRVFVDSEALGIAFAAALLEGGVKRDLVVDFLDFLVSYNVREDPKRRRKHVTAYEEAFASRSSTIVAMVGDGVNMRTRIGGWDSGWIQPGTFVPLKDFHPRVTIQVDLAALKKALRPPRRGNRRP